MRIVSWNLKDGGIDNGDPSRLARQMRLLANVGADVALIQEAKRWLDDGKHGLHLAERILGMRGYLARAPRHDCHLVVFIRPGSGLEVDRERHETHPPFWHAQARVACHLPSLGQPLMLASAHHTPFSPDIREQEACATSDLAKGWAVVGGDFNDRGLGDPPADWGSLPGYKTIRHGPDDQTAARVLQQAGLVDVADHLGDHTPTAGFGHDSIPIRCDRIYVSAPLVPAIAGYQVIEQEESDHHLVLADLGGWC